jgi:glycosyltransferase involved in cell wall biosynthesis
MPLFSVVIPTYNRANALRNCLESLVKQTFKDFEVLVCDDGSEDATKKVVDSYRDKLDLNYIWQENWGGPARPRNNGIDASKGEWICFLDSDDWFYPNKLAEVFAVLSGSDFIYHGLDYYNHSYEKVLSPKVRLAEGDIFKNLLCKGNCFANSSVSVRKSVLVEIGALSEDKNLVAVEDFDLWLRVSQATNKFKGIEKNLGGYQIGGDNLTEHSDKQINRLTTLYSKHIDYLSIMHKGDALSYLSYSNGIIQVQLGRNREARKSFLYAAKNSGLGTRTIKSTLRWGLSFFNIAPSKIYMKLIKTVK